MAYENFAGPNRGAENEAASESFHYAKIREGVIWMLTMYAKNEEESIPAHVLRKIKEEIDG